MSATPRTIPILFYGAMRKKFGKRRDLAVCSLAEMSSAFRATMPGWREFCLKHDFKILVGETPITEDQLGAPLGRTESIKIIPVVAGAKDGGVTAILGAVLYYAGGVVSAWNPVIGAGMQGIGMSMMLGGVAQLLAGTPKGMFNPSTTTSDIDTFTFNSPTATTGQGGSVPILYGVHRVSGHVISAGIDAQTWQDKGFGGAAPDNDGTQGGDGDTSPWVWAIAP